MECIPYVGVPRTNCRSVKESVKIKFTFNLRIRIDIEGNYLVQIYPDSEWTPDVPSVSIVAVAVSDFAYIPEGLIWHTIPAGTYMKVTHKGPESQIGETYDSIRDRGICGCRLFDFEYWASIDSLEQEESIIDIYLPLEA